jgi:hypothetical protein
MEKSLKLLNNASKVCDDKLTLKAETKYNDNTIYLVLTADFKTPTQVEYYGIAQLLDSSIKEASENPIQKEYYIDKNTMEASPLEAMLYEGPELLEYLANKNNLLDTVIESFNDKESINNYVTTNTDTTEKDKTTYSITTQHKGISINLTVSFDKAEVYTEAQTLKYNYTAKFDNNFEGLIKETQTCRLSHWDLVYHTVEDRMRHIIEIDILPEIVNNLKETIDINEETK